MCPDSFSLIKAVRKKTLQFGLLGAGGIAKAYAEAFKTVSSCRLVAVADIQVDAAAAIARDVEGCRSFGSCDSMIRAIDLDAVIICTPPSTHEALAIRCIRSDVHVLCEKPLTIGLESTRRMLEAAESAGVLLTMASKFRYVEDVLLARRMIENGDVGQVVLFENSFTSCVNMTGRWNSDPEISGGGVLIDNGTHSLDLARYFLGPLVDVQVVEGKRIQNLAVEETVRVFVKSTTGAMGSIDLSWSINKELESYISIYGTQGIIRVGWKESVYKSAGSEGWTVFGSGYNKVHAFASQIENFAKAVLGLEPLRITSSDALASVEVIEAAYGALRHGRWTGVEEFLLNHLEVTRALSECEETGRLT